MSLSENISFFIRPIGASDRMAVLEVYRLCEDFLALGPDPHASLEMVDKDLELSKSEGGLYCGIFLPSGDLLGVVDYISSGFEGDLGLAFLELLMIARPYRNQGLGRQVVETVESEIRRNPTIRAIQAGVQVNNPDALRFWQSRGFRVISPAKEYPDGTTAYRLEKRFD